MPTASVGWKEKNPENETDEVLSHHQLSLEICWLLAVVRTGALLKLPGEGKVGVY